MFFTYLAREVAHRRRQTLIVVFGLALAISLVILVNSISAGVRDAQAEVLESVYGVGTDITVSQPAPPGTRGAGRFEFEAEAGTATEDGSRQVSRSRLSTTPGTATFDAAALTQAADVRHVAAVAGTLALENTTFSGELPDLSQGLPQPGQGATGGADGAGGSAFDVDRFSVLGIDPTSAAVGPLTTVSVVEGRALTADDSAANVALLDSAYASGASLAVGGTLAVGDGTVEIVGIVESSTGAGVSTGTDVYLPLTTAQTLSGLTAQVSDVYIQADSAENIPSVATALEAALPDATVSTQEDLAGSVSGSLSTASDLVGNLGRWLSLAVLAAAFALAILLTVSGVGRRTREFGTLKAIGWRNGRVVGQVAGESLFQGLLGGITGLALGAGAVAVFNAVGITLTGSAASAAGPNLPAGFSPPGGGPFRGVTEAASSTVDIALKASLNPTVVVAAIGLALLGGVLAGAFGGRRAARLSPAEALRSAA